MADRRTLLYLARELPMPVVGEARLRTYNWLIHLSKHFDITFVAPMRRAAGDHYVDAVRPYCIAVHMPPLLAPHAVRRILARLAAEGRFLGRGLPPEANALQNGPPGLLVRALGGEGSFDVVFAERWTWGPAAFALGRDSVLDAGALQAPRDAEKLRTSRNPIRRLLHGVLERAAARHETHVVRSAGLVLTLSPADSEAVASICGTSRAVTLPAGLDTHYFTPQRAQVDRREIAFYGALTNPTQRDALLHLQRDVMPAVRESVPAARLTVVDADPIPEARDALVTDSLFGFTGVLDDPRPELWRAAVAALPLRFGAGSTTRLAQLLALGVPVVATPAVVRALGLQSGEGVLVAHDGSEFARLLVQVLTDASLRGDLSRRGREVAESRLSLDVTYHRWSARFASGTIAD
jgi:glycosyltransferase involved in cell wall biosynthesis